MVQRFGTDKVGSSFAYVLCVWFISIAGIGIYNIAKYDPTVFKALNPKYIINYFKRNKKDAWISIGGVVMCITALSDLPHQKRIPLVLLKVCVRLRFCLNQAMKDPISNITLGALGSSSSWLRFPLSSLKLAVKIFDSTGHFGMWHGEVLDSLFQQGLNIAIEEKKSKEKALKNKFLKKSGQNKLLIKKRLFRFDYQPDIKFEDEDLALMLLSFILDEFEHLETMLLYGKENVSLDVVCSSLYSHELRKQDKMKTKSTTSEEALVARGHQQSQAKRRRRRSKSKDRAVAKDECAFCQEKGHWKKDCPKLKKKGKSLQDANIAECKSNAESDISLVAMPSTSSHPDEWILDSGYTYHIIHSGIFFKISRTQWWGCLHGILRDVRYVPKLKKHCISLGALESKGLVMMIRDEFLKQLQEHRLLMASQICRQKSCLLNLFCLTLTMSSDGLPEE
ncbi:Potassium transporter 5 [Capsicum baccatum]|uniref:Potassium transporter 5 n=1 Tax=Capsicum baccatum TaxID=33114 RepID=A0A2G2VZW2_CAPBA|nr:Potassium transporter 5 [Capsicum baccatum]